MEELYVSLHVDSDNLCSAFTTDAFVVEECKLSHNQATEGAGIFIDIIRSGTPIRASFINAESTVLFMSSLYSDEQSCI